MLSSLEHSLVAIILYIDKTSTSLVVNMHDALKTIQRMRWCHTDELLRHKAARRHVEVRAHNVLRELHRKQMLQTCTRLNQPDYCR